LTAEDASRQGRVDLTLKFNSRFWLFAFKVVELEPTGRALQQLKDRVYAAQYRALGQPIHFPRKAARGSAGASCRGEVWLVDLGLAAKIPS